MFFRTESSDLYEIINLSSYMLVMNYHKRSIHANACTGRKCANIWWNQHARIFKNHPFSMYFSYFHSFVPPKSSSMRITQEYLNILESYYQNVQVSGEKWHMSHFISCPIAWEINSKFISVQLDHPVLYYKLLVITDHHWGMICSSVCGKITRIINIIKDFLS